MFNFPERFARFICITPCPERTRHKVVGDCWCWTGANSGKPLPEGVVSLSGRGYGKLKWKFPKDAKQKKYQAHRAFFVWMTGIDIEDRVLDHLCEVRSCINPLHLEPTDVRTNTLRGQAILFKIMEKYGPSISEGEDYDGCGDE